MNDVHSLSTETTTSLNLLNMESSLLDRNTVSIIRSPNKQFYCMAALDSHELEQFCVTREFRLLDNVLGHCSNEMVDGRHLHSSEQVNNGNFTQRPFDKVEDQMPNCRMNYFCYPVSPELLSFNSQKSFDISNSSTELTVRQSDCFPELLASSSEAVLQVDVAEPNRTASLEGGILHDQTHIGNDVLNTLSLAEFSDPVDVHYELEGIFNSNHAKSRRSRRECVRKSKSFYNNCNVAWKDNEQRLNSSSETDNQYIAQMNSEIISGNALANSFTVKSCSHQLRSNPTLFHNVNIGKNIRSENSDSNEDSESSGNEAEAQTSGITSTDHESTAIDQTWDGYQVPLYAAISDDSTEEKLDATCLQGDWQQLADEFMDFSDFGNDSSSHIQHQAPELDSDTDVEELLHLIQESSDALRLTRLSLSRLKRTDESVQSSFHKEPLATCRTNINCLRDLLGVVCQKDWTVADVNQLSALLKQWENVEAEFLRLTSWKDLSISNSDVIIDVSPDASHVSTFCEETNIDSSENDMTLLETTSPSSCYWKCGSESFVNRLDVFSCGTNKLLKETSYLRQNATLTPIQIIFFIILLLIALFYLIALSSCGTDMMKIKVDPQLRYVIGPPPL